MRERNPRKPTHVLKLIQTARQNQDDSLVKKIIARIRDEDAAAKAAREAERARKRNGNGRRRGDQ